MRANGCQGVRRQKKVRTTIPEPAAQRAPDLVDRQFTSPAPNRLLVADFTYVKLLTGTFAYVAFVIDAFAGTIIGWEGLCTLARRCRCPVCGPRSGRSTTLRQGLGRDHHRLVQERVRSRRLTLPTRSAAHPQRRRTRRSRVSLLCQARDRPTGRLTGPRGCMNPGRFSQTSWRDRRGVRFTH
jgi:hypothetical protein